MYSKFLALVALSLAGLLSGCVTGTSLTQEQIASSWVGQDVRQLETRWSDVTWYRSTDREKNIYTLEAQFGEEAYVRDDSYDDGEDFVEEYTRVPRNHACTLYFFADAQTMIISDYRIVGSCRGYIGGGNRPPAPIAPREGDTVVRRVPG